MQPLRRHRAIFAREKYRQSLAYLICLPEIVTTKNNFLTQNAQKAKAFGDPQEELTALPRRPSWM